MNTYKISCTTPKFLFVENARKHEGNGAVFEYHYVNGVYTAYEVDGTDGERNYISNKFSAPSLLQLRTVCLNHIETKYN